MTEEVQVVPKWLGELEAKREKRLKVRLGHETGAGSPCLTCGEKCPGLDLHFWRKICKNCKCGKESHDVHDDDIYGMAQFQLTGSKPIKPRKIVLPGKKEEVLLEWTPRGHNDAIESYLKDIPSHLLPIKGSAAAQERKQLLQKQIPLHDIDPLLCDALTETEIEKMNEYLAHIKQNSVGVGQIIKLSQLKRGNQYNIGQAGAKFLSNRVVKHAPNSEIVQLQGADHSNDINLPKHLQNLSIHQKQGLDITEIDKVASDVDKIRNIRYDSLGNRIPSQQKEIHESYQNPSTITTIKDVRYPVGGIYNRNNMQIQNLYDQNIYLPNQPYSNVLDYQNPVKGSYLKDVNYSANTLDNTLRNAGHKNDPSDIHTGNNKNTKSLPNFVPNSLVDPEELEQLPNTNRARNLYGNTNVNVYNHDYSDYDDSLENVQHAPNSKANLPHYVPGKFTTYAEQRKPQPVSNIRDLAFTTYDLNKHFDPCLENEKSSDGSKSTLPGYRPVKFDPRSLNVTEMQRNPVPINIGTINDVEYPTNEIKTAEHLENDIFDEALYPKSIDNEIFSSGKLPSCHKCKNTFNENSIVIGTERTDALWHTDCFKCAGCNQNLADLVYFYHKESDEIYCGRDYAKIRGIPRCQACDELIFVKEYCLAENCTFHVKHFCCYECDTPLAGQNYVMEDSQPVCLPCYENLKAEKCNTCFRVIKPDEQGANLNGVHFHASDECFCCRICKKSLLGTKLLFKNQKLYCSSVCREADD